MTNNKEQAASPTKASSLTAPAKLNQPANTEKPAAVPLESSSDYSDYSFTIEQKSEFTDALFASEAELNQALIQSRADKQAQATNPIEPLEPAAEQQTIELDFSAFKPAADELDDHGSNSPESNKLLFINNTLNDSPARKNLPETAAAAVFKLQLASIIAALQQPQPGNEDVEQTADTAPHSETGSQLSALKALIKTKSLALSQKGRAKLEQSRAELDEYLGRSLPERSEALDFMLPNSNHKLLDSELLAETQLKKLFTSKRNPLLSILNKSEQQLALLTKAQWSGSKKLAVLNLYQPLLSEKILTVIAMFERKPIAYDDSKRCDTASQALAVMKLLITVYKQAYSEFYSASNLYYGPHRATINHCATALIDCLLLELRLCIALHCQPPLASIKTLNKLFHVLSLYEPQLLDESCYCSLDGGNSTPTAMFTRYQLWCFIDGQTLSSKLHKTLFNYVAQLEPQLSLLPLAVTSQLPTITLGQQMLGVQLLSEQPASLLGPAAKHKAPSSALVYIPVQAVFNQIKSDYVEALKAHIHQRQQHSCSLLNNVKPPQRLMLLAALNQTIRNAEQQQTINRFSLYQPIKLKAYSGLEHCHTLLRYRYAQQLADSMDQDVSTPKTVVPPPASKGQWLCAGEDEHAIYLQIAEQRLGIATDIGELLLLQREAEAETPAENKDEGSSQNVAAETLQLTLIVRIERDHLGNILIVANKLAVAMTHVKLLHQQQSLTAIIALSSAGRLLITDLQHRHNSHRVLTLAFPDETSCAATISGLQALGAADQVLKLTD
jgi:hypothetical protein